MELEQVQRMATEMTKDVDVVFIKTLKKELGLFSLEKKRLM